MKKIIFLAFFSFAFSSISIAQVELKINPLGVLLFNNANIVGEYMVNEDIGIEAGIGLVYGKYGGIINEEFTRSGFRLLLAGKYYFTPEDGGDKFYAGIYLRPRTVTYTDDNDDNVDRGFKRSAFGVGLMTGYKWVGARGITFEFGGGLGRALGKNSILDNNSEPVDIPRLLRLDGFLRLSIGYRFGGE